MKFEFKLDKEQVMEIGKGAKKIGKAIIVEGTKAVALKSAAAFITQSFDEGIGSVKKLDLDDVLKGGKKKKPKAALFSFKKKKDEGLEAEVELETTETDEVKVEDKETK